MTDPSAAAGVPPPEAGGPRRHPPRAGPLRGEEGDRLTVRRLPLGSRRARGGDRDLPRDRHHRRPQGALEEGPMSAIPAGFRAYVAEKSEDGPVARGVRAFAEADLPPGEVEIRILWSSVNYKDGLATTANGRGGRLSPPIPGLGPAGGGVAPP